MRRRHLPLIAVLLFICTGVAYWYYSGNESGELKNDLAALPAADDVAPTGLGQRPESPSGSALEQQERERQAPAPEAATEQQPQVQRASEPGPQEQQNAAISPERGERGRSADRTVARKLTSEQEKRLDDFDQRKSEMSARRDLLMKERDQLHLDVKDAGVIRSQDQFDTFKKRIADLETRITGFNEEVRKLNEEQKAFLEEAKGK